MNCQTEISPSVVSAYCSLPSQGWKNWPSPTAFIIVGATPHSGDSSSRQTKPTTTSDRMAGTKNTVR